MTKIRMKQLLQAVMIIATILAISTAAIGCKGKSQTEKKTEEEGTMAELSVTEYNTKKFVDELEVKENPAKGAAERLEEIGCSKIISLTDIDKSEGAYSMKICDDKGDIYQITMSYEGYLGVVRDKDGEYLITPID